MSDRNNVDVVRALTRIAESIQSLAKEVAKINVGVQTLNETTRESFEGPIRLLTEIEEGMLPDEHESGRDVDDMDVLDESETWRLG